MVYNIPFDLESQLEHYNTEATICNIILLSFILVHVYNCFVGIYMYVIFTSLDILLLILEKMGLSIPPSAL